MSACVSVCGDALRQAAAALDAAESMSRPHAMAQALSDLARCHLDMGQAQAADRYLRRAVAWAAASGSIDLWVNLLCEHAECAAALAQSDADEAVHAGHFSRERARDAAFEAAHLAPRVSDATWEAAVLLRVSDVLNRCGDHDDAARLQARAAGLLGAQQAQRDSF